MCGRIGHANKECSNEMVKVEALNGDSSKYGSWMRALITDRQHLRFNQH